MYIYVVAMIIIAIGVYAILVKDNIIKKIIGLSIFSNGIHLFLISLGYKLGGIAPIANEINFKWISTAAVDPFPQAMVLTSIVINLSVTALALSIYMSVYKKFKSANASKIRGLKG
jgi:multisubunit Na+/H+ antiporter MnhC subunit